jgi:hypothetical protein
MPDRAQLPELHLEILKLVWSEWNNTQTGRRIVDGGLTRDELFDGLKDKRQSNWLPRRPKATDQVLSPVLPSAPPLVAESETLKRHLHHLCIDDPKYLTSAKVTDRRGSPFVYKINDMTVITWPSTAFLMTEIWKAKHVPKHTFVESMVRQKKVRFLADEASTREQIVTEIESQINWCIAQRYLEHVEQRELAAYRPADRLHYESRLLAFIAQHARPDTSVNT